MSRIPVSMFLTTAALAAAAPLPAEEPPAPWQEMAHDLFVDGELRSKAVVLRRAEPDQWAVLLDRSDPRAMIVDDEKLTLTRGRLTGLKIGEHGFQADGVEETVPAEGSVVRLAGTSLWVVQPRMAWVIAPHPGQPGETDPDTVFGIVPTWRALYERHEPDPAVVERLKAVKEPVQLTVLFGTWCGDSKREVTRLLKALDQAGNDKIELSLVTLARDFHEPAALIRDLSLTNVPTLIVKRGGELGRVVETPAGETFAADLADILERRPLVHPGRWKRGASLARGRYSVRDAEGRERGGEEWELFAGEEGGTLLHARTNGPEGMTEVWHRRDDAGRTAAIEVTRQHGAWHSRSRYQVKDGMLNASTRGNGSGTISQQVLIDSETVFLSPSVADRGLTAVFAARSQGPRHRPAYVLGGAAGVAAGDPRSLELSPTGEERITVASAAVDTLRVAGRVAGAGVEAWLHADLGIPVRWRRSSGEDAVLSRFERSEPAAEADATDPESGTR